MRRSWELCALVLLALPSCSLLGLSQFDFPECAELNDRDGIEPATACMLWRLDETGDCAFGPADADADGAQPLRCGGSDCDDGSREVGPGRTETCNGVDDDCNGLVDDAAGEPEARQTVLTAAETIAWLSADDTAIGLGVTFSAGGLRYAEVDGPDPVTASEMLTVRSSTPSASLTAATSEGCADVVGTPLGLRACPPATCGGGTTCVTGPAGSFCEDAVLARMPAPLPTDCTTHAECGDGLACNGIERCEPRSPLADSQGCVPATSAGCTGRCDEATDACVALGPTLSACAVGRAATTRVEDEDAWLIAVTTGCGAGEAARLATFAPGDGALVLRGDERLAAGYPAIDGVTSGCGAPIGGAVIDTFTPSAPGGRATVPQGLAAWVERADDCDLTSCSGPARVVGAWRESGTLDAAAITWASATGSGASTELSPDAVAVDVSALTGLTEGFIVAVTTRAGVSAALVPPLPLPAPECSGMGAPPCVQTSPPHPTSIDTTAGATGRVTPTLSSPALVAIGSTTSATEVSVATSASGRIVFSWVEADAVVVQPATLSAGAPLPTGAPIRIAAAAARSLDVTHVSEGVATVGVDVDGTTVSAENAGGFVVSFATSAGSFALRLADVTMAPVVGPVRLGPSATSLRAFVGASGVVHVVGASDRDLVVFPSACGTAL